jgi:hypothetical protein
VSDCPFYKTSTLHIPSQELRADQQSTPPTTIQKAWCTHKHSPCLENIIGGASLLPCIGISTACTIAKELLADFDS